MPRDHAASEPVTDILWAGGKMIVDISELDPDGSLLTGEEPSSVLDLDIAEDVKPAGPIRYSIRVFPAGDGVVAQGTTKVDMTFECVRCAEFFTTTVCEPEFSVAVETPNKDESIDLTPDIRESIILAFPANPLCARDCRGLCQRCRTNLNKSVCRCADSSAEKRWSVLDNLQLK